MVYQIVFIARDSLMMQIHNHTLSSENQTKKNHYWNRFLKDFTSSGECLAMFSFKSSNLFSSCSHLRCIFNWQPVDFVSRGKKVVTVENPLADENYTFLQPTRLNTHKLYFKLRYHASFAPCQVLKIFHARWTACIL